MITAPPTIRPIPEDGPDLILGADDGSVENHEDDAEPFYRNHVRRDLERIGNIDRDALCRDEDAARMAGTR